MKTMIIMLFLVLQIVVQAQSKALTGRDILLRTDSTHPELQAITAELQSIQALRSQNIAISNPTVLYFVEGIGLPVLTEQRVQVNINAENPFRIAGKNNASDAQAQVLLQEYAVKRASVRAAIKKHLAEYWYAQNMVEVLRKTSSVADSMAKSATILLQAGEIGKIDALRMNIEAQTARNLLSQWQEQELVTKYRLLRAAFLPDSTNIAADTIIIGSQDIRPAGISAPYAAALSKEAAANAEVRVAEESLLPNIGAGYYFHNYGDGFLQYSGFEVSLQVPLLFFWNQQPQIQQKKALALQQQFLVQQTRSEQDTKWQEIITSFTLAKQRVQSAERSMLQQAEELVELANEEYRQGNISLLELLLTRQAGLETRTTYLAAQRDLYLALIEAEIYSEVEYVEIP